MPDEQAIFKCGFCGVPILTFWEPNHGGLLRGEYLLAGDDIFHPWCWDKHIGGSNDAGGSADLDRATDPTEDRG